MLKYIILSLYFFRDNSSLIKTLYAGLLKQNELHGIFPYVIPACNNENYHLIWRENKMAINNQPAVKDMARSVIDALPDKATIDDIMYALYVKAKFDHGDREIRQGKGVSHDTAKKRLKKWVK